MWRFFWLFSRMKLFSCRLDNFPETCKINIYDVCRSCSSFLSFYLFIYAFILFSHRNYCKIIELTLVIELMLVIKHTFECFFIHWTGEVFNIFHERTLIWWYDLRYSCFTNTILIICVLINFTKWLFVFNFVRTKMKSFPNGRFIRLIQELHCLSFWTRFTQVLFTFYFL